MFGPAWCSNELMCAITRTAGKIAYFLCKFFHLPAAGWSDCSDCSALNAGRRRWRRIAAAVWTNSGSLPAHVIRATCIGLYTLDTSTIVFQNCKPADTEV